MKRLKRKSKIFIVLSCLFAFIGLFAFSSYAYEFDDNGNMVSSNLMNYQDISSSTFTDLDNYQFKMNWGGVSSTITLPDVTYAANTSYTFSLTSVSGTTTYWAYNLYWNYTDSTSERFTNNQSLAVGRYSFTSDSTKTLSSITWTINFDAVFENLMFNVGDEAIAFEPYGYTWYSQDNYNTYGSNQYDVGYTTGVNEGALSGVGSVLYYKNLDFAWFRYYPLNQNFEHYIVFVYNGELGWWEGSSIFDFDPDSFDTSTPASWLESTVVHLYGFFGYTDYDDSLGAFIEGSDSYTSADPDKSCTLNFEFSTPLSLQNVSFEMSGFTECTFYSGTWQYLQPLSVYTSSDISGVTLSNVRGVECYWSLADVWNNNCYLHSNVYDGYYNSGYTNGYNTARVEYIGQVQDLQSKVDFLQSSLQEMRVTLNEAINGGNYSHLIWTIAASPWESFKNIWNVNFLGINIASVVTGFITALLILYIIKKVF